MPHSDSSFLAIATEPSVISRAVRIALVIGVILAIINHGNVLLSGQIDGTTVFKILLTFFVPYSVSTYSSVQAVRERMQMLTPDEEEIGKSS